MNILSGTVARTNIRHKHFLAWVLLCWSLASFGQQYNDVSLQVSASPALASTGDTLSFFIQVNNEGLTNLTGLTVLAELPVSIGYLSHDGPINTSFDPVTGIWQIGNILTQDMPGVSLEIKAIALQEGVVYMPVQVQSLNEIDVDSEPGNNLILEDDEETACVSIPYQLCTATGESVTLNAPDGYPGYEWYLDNGGGAVLVSTEATFMATEPGNYSLNVLGSSCPQNSCCPVVLEENCVSNLPPIANLDSVGTSMNVPILVAVLDNDIDTDDGIDTSSVNIVSPPINGTASVNDDGTITYFPNDSFAGLDTLIYEICDNGIPAPVSCDTALLVVSVTDQTFDLALNKSLLPGQLGMVEIGDEVTYVLTVTNQGALAATEMEVADHIPDGLSLSAGNIGWTLAPNGDAVFTINETLEPGESTSVEITLTVVYGASGETITNIGEITAATDGNGQPGVDVDSTPGNGTNGEDDLGSQAIEILPHDPTGYIYCDKTGMIITGGTISVTGPGQVYIVQDGSLGYYEFYTDGTEGVYNLTYTHPEGLIKSDQCLPGPGPFDPTGLGSQITLGAGADASNTYLSDTTCAANPYYLSFELQQGDPPVYNNNLPVQCSYIGSIVCQDEGNGQQDGNESGFPGMIVNLFDCQDTLTVLMTTLTDTLGHYAFDGLPPGGYMVQFELPDNSRFVEGSAVNAAGFSDCITLEAGDCDTTTSACVLICPTVDAGPDLEICFGEQAQIQSFMPYGNGAVSWTPAVGLNDPNVLAPLASPFLPTTFVVTYDDGLGCADTDSLFVNVTANCLEDLIVGDSFTVQANCEFGDPLFCFDVPYEELSGYSFQLNGLPYDAEFGPCDYLRARFYSLSALVGLGDGNFRLDNWTVNGQVHSATFQNVTELIDMMNAWDPLGAWQLDPVTLSLEGGIRQSYYTSLRITDLQLGTIYDFTLYQFYAPNSSYVILPEGENELVITRLSDGVVDTVHIKAACVTTDYVEISIPVGTIDTICFDLSELDGEVTHVFSPCEDGEANPAEFEIMGDTVCVEVFAMYPGDTETCYLVCDDNGVCDTTNVFVNVYDEDLNLVQDSLCTPKEVPIVGEILLNDHINNDLVSLIVTVPPNHGTAVVNPDNTITYTPEDGYCNNGENEPLDEFTYQVCTAFDCETTTVSVQVKCDGLIVYNGFSPNGDGVNDTFKITGLGNYDSHKLMVFNRWGNKVFQSENYRNDWDGYWESKRLPNGTYFYLIELNGGETWMSGYLQIWW